MQFLILTLFWLAGIAFGATVAWPIWIYGAVLGGSLLVAIVVRQHSYLLLAAVSLAFFITGAARYQIAQPHITPSHIAYYNGQDVTIVGRVIDEPDLRDRSVNLRIAVDSLTVDEETINEIDGEILLQTPRFPVYEYGSQLEFSGKLQTPPEGETFSYRDYLARQGIHSMMTWPRVNQLNTEQGNPIYTTIYHWKSRAQATINRLIPEPQSGLLSGILLGVGHAMSPDLRDDFRITGITHIVVISGFNIAVISGIFIRLGDPLFGKRGAAVFAIMGIILYTFMVGADASVVRAAIMGTIYVLGQRFLGRPNAALGSLFLAAFIMTVVNPSALWDIGFQLSFAATLSLMLYADPIVNWARAWLNHYFERPLTEKFLGLLSEAVLITIAAQILTLPLLMYYFQEISLISLVANAFILPAQSGVMLWGGLTTIVGMVIPAVGQLFGWVAYLFLWYTIEAARLFAQVPYAKVPFAFSFASLLTVYSITTAITWYSQQEPTQKINIRHYLRQQLPQHALLGVSVIGVLLSWQWYATQPDGLLHVAFLDVGQGDSIFIQTPSGRQILIDGGHYPTVLNDQLGRQMPFWDREIDLVIATHADADHISGLPGVFDRYTVNQLLVATLSEEQTATYNALLTNARIAGTKLHEARAGEIIAIGDEVILEVVHPDSDFDIDDRNDHSVSIRLVYHNFSLLLTGDAEESAEAEMLASGQPLRSIVFKAGHHGAKNASTTRFLEAVQPHIVIISAGKDNRFGHPHPEVLERIAAVGAIALRTDELGTISVRTDGQTMWWMATR